MDFVGYGTAASYELDVTDVVPGTYTLRITVNPEGVIDESDTTNNVFTKQVSL